MDKPRTHWANIGEATFVGGMKLLFFIARVLGRWPFRLVLYPVICWYVATKNVARAASREYLGRIATTTGRAKPGLLAIIAHFFHFGESLLERLLLWSGNYPLDKVAVFGAAPLAGYIRRKQGCLLICSHLGNIELCKALSRKQKGLCVTMLVHTRHATTFNRMLADISPESQFSMMQVTELSASTMLILAERIRAGQFVIIAGDRVPVNQTGRVAHVDFLGEKAAFPVGPYVLASLLSCPVHLMFATKNGNTDEIHFEPFRQRITLPARHERAGFLGDLAADYASRLERYCLRSPYEWFNFYPFWENR